MFFWFGFQWDITYFVTQSPILWMGEVQHNVLNLQGKRKKQWHLGGNCCMNMTLNRANVLYCLLMPHCRTWRSSHSTHQQFQLTDFAQLQCLFAAAFHFSRQVCHLTFDVHWWIVKDCSILPNPQCWKSCRWSVLIGLKPLLNLLKMH